MYHSVILILALAATAAQGYPQGHNDAGDDSDMYLESDKSSSSSSSSETGEASQQTFYPSFPPFQNPPLGHSRPFYYQPEAAYSQRPQSGYQQQQVAYDSPRYSGYKDDSYRAAANADSHGILGSGNFGVIRGGTFYDNDREASNNYESDGDDFSSYFRNGHGRPSFYFGGVPNPRPYQHEQFANFRDFADINTPSNPAYSQYVVVYVNKNSTRKSEEVEDIKNMKPKNIIESLALLDLESSTPSSNVAEVEAETEIPQKKVSKSKEKLARTPPEKKWKIRIKAKAQNGEKQTKDFHEPLLALS